MEVFECCINGQEIAPAYTEQNDPIAQRERLEHQAGGEQQKLDEDFLVALEHGMPPAGGMGMGIDRLCMMLLGQESIRDVILFPQLKPKWESVKPIRITDYCDSRIIARKLDRKLVEKVIRSPDKIVLDADDPNRQIHQNRFLDDQLWKTFANRR